MPQIGIRRNSKSNQQRLKERAKHRRHDRGRGPTIGKLNEYQTEQTANDE